MSYPSLSECLRPIGVLAATPGVRKHSVGAAYHRAGQTVSWGRAELCAFSTLRRPIS